MQESSMADVALVPHGVDAPGQEAASLDRKYKVGFVAGVLIGLAVGVPGGYALLQASGRDPVATAMALKGARVAALINQSQRALQTAKLTRAVSLLVEADALDPSNESIQNNLCVAYTGLARYEEAIAACKLALLLKEDFQLARNNLAWAESERAKAGAGAPSTPVAR
jgi:tetratricopeptide (TPR) repeat protein